MNPSQNIGAACTSENQCRPEVCHRRQREQVGCGKPSLGIGRDPACDARLCAYIEKEEERKEQKGFPQERLNWRGLVVARNVRPGADSQRQQQNSRSQTYSENHAFNRTKLLPNQNEHWA